MAGPQRGAGGCPAGNEGRGAGREPRVCASTQGRPGRTPGCGLGERGEQRACSSRERSLGQGSGCAGLPGGRTGSHEAGSQPCGASSGSRTYLNPLVAMLLLPRRETRSSLCLRSGLGLAPLAREAARTEKGEGRKSAPRPPPPTPTPLGTASPDARPPRGLQESFDPTTLHLPNFPWTRIDQPSLRSSTASNQRPFSPGTSANPPASRASPRACA